MDLLGAVAVVVAPDHAHHPDADHAVRGAAHRRSLDTEREIRVDRVVRGVQPQGDHGVTGHLVTEGPVVRKPRRRDDDPVRQGLARRVGADAHVGDPRSGEAGAEAHHQHAGRQRPRAGRHGRLEDSCPRYHDDVDVADPPQCAERVEQPAHHLEQRRRHPGQPVHVRLVPLQVHAGYAVPAPRALPDPSPWRRAARPGTGCAGNDITTSSEPSLPQLPEPRMPNRPIRSPWSVVAPPAAGAPHAGSSRAMVPAPAPAGAAPGSATSAGRFIPTPTRLPSQDAR